MHSNSNLPLVISGKVIHQEAEGRYSLNDLHKAAGGITSQKPSEWVSNKQTQDLIAEIDKAGIPALVSRHGGRSPGTFACKELVYSYAMWISPSFHLKVIRAYDALVTGDFDSLPELMRSQIGGIVKSVVHRQIEEAIAIALPSLVDGVIARRQIGVRHGLTAGQVWAQHGLPKLKGAAQVLSRWLEGMGCAIDGGGRAEVGGKASKLFDPDKVAKAMKTGLLEHCKKYAQERQGQSCLHLIQKAA